MTTTRKMVAGTEARRQAYERQQAALAASRANLIERLIDKYLTEPDRDYAEVMYGDPLRERGVDTKALTK